MWLKDPSWNQTSPSILGVRIPLLLLRSAQREPRGPWLRQPADKKGTRLGEELTMQVLLLTAPLAGTEVHEAGSYPARQSQSLPPPFAQGKGNVQSVDGLVGRLIDLSGSSSSHLFPSAE